LRRPCRVWRSRVLAPHGGMFTMPCLADNLSASWLQVSASLGSRIFSPFQVPLLDISLGIINNVSHDHD
jgi:hypothetical protein